MPKLGKFHFKQVIVLGTPLLAGLISEFLMILADSAMVGRLGTEYLAAINQTKVIMVATIGLNVLNILFNYILIFGKFGFPALGIVGAALGTVLAQGLGTLFMVIYILLAPSIKVYGCLQFRSLRLAIFIDLFRSTGPIRFQLSIALFLFLYYETIVANIGTLYLAATHIVFTVFVLKRAILGGFAEGGSILVGNALGEGAKKEAVRFAYATELMAIIIGAALFVFIWLFPDNIVRIFNSETELVGVGSDALRFFAVFIFFEAIGFPFEVLFTHNGWGRFVLVSEIITNLTFVVGLTLLLTRGFGFGIYGAWSAFAVYLVFHSLFMFGGFFSRRWLKTEVDSEWLEMEPARSGISR